MIRTEILIHNPVQANLTDENTEKWTPFIFDPQQVEAARVSSENDVDIDFGMTVIYMKSGHSMIINMFYDVFLMRVYGIVEDKK